MKRGLIFLSLLAIIALVMQGCPGNEDPPPPDRIGPFPQGKWMVTHGGGGADQYFGVEIDSDGNLVDVIGLFNINHPTSGTSSFYDDNSFDISSDDLGGSKYFILGGYLYGGEEAGSGYFDYWQDQAGVLEYLDIVPIALSTDISTMNPLLPKFENWWSGSLDDGSNTIPVLIHLGFDGEMVDVTGLGTFSQGNYVVLATGEVVMYIINSNGDEYKLVGTSDGNTFSGVWKSNPSTPGTLTFTMGPT